MTIASVGLTTGVVAEGKRSFWLHQAAEYVVGGALVATGLQSPEPLVPTVIGALIALNTACADGPLGAFRRVSRRLHRVLDWLVLAVAIAASAAPNLDEATRIVMIMIVIVFAVVVWRTDYSPKQPRSVPSNPSRADDLGRQAGRLAGRAAGRARDKWRQSR
ncbi:MAG: hypothetical protein FGM29_09320 [Actinobacteria bacterium]|nr:hypothetical protein [Actinomycetota bacterium]